MGLVFGGAQDEISERPLVASPRGGEGGGGLVSWAGAAVETITQAVGKYMFDGRRLGACQRAWGCQKISEM